MADQHPYVVNPELTGISLAYRNQLYIGDSVLPRVPVTSEVFKYTTYSKEQFLTVPKTLIGRKGQANEVELIGKEETASVETHSLKDVVPQADIDAASGKQNPSQKATIYVTELLQLGRELRAASIFQNSANYGVVESSAKIDDADTNTVDLIQDIIDSMMVTPNTAVMNRVVASKLRRSAAIVKAFGSTTGTGMVPLEFIKEFFGFQNIFIGQAMVNSAKKGQTPTLTGAWANDISLIHINPIAEVDMGLTFGFTAEFESRQIKTYFDEDRGSKGAEIVRGVEQLKDLVIAKECGAIIKNVLTA